MITLNFEEFWTGVPNEMMEDGAVSNEAVAMYYYIGETVNNKWYSTTTLSLLLEGLQLTNVDRYYETYKNALQELVSLGYITIYNKERKTISSEELAKVKKNDRLIIAIDPLENGYVQAFGEEVKAIMDYAKDRKIKNRTAFLRYYLLIQKWTSFEGGERIGFFTIKQATEICGVDSRLFKSFNEALKELGIFYYNNDYITPVRGLNTATYFARATMITESSFEEAVRMMAENNGWVKLNKDKANQKRSEAMIKYHQDRKERKALQEEEAREKELGLITLDEVEVGTNDKEIPKYVSKEIDFEKVLVQGYECDDFFINLKVLWLTEKINDNEFKAYKEEVEQKGFIIDLDENLYIYKLS